MFTGLVQGVGRLAGREMRAGDARLRIGFGDFAAGGLHSGDPRSDGLAIGESIAVNGVCLTVVAHDGAGFEADASSETLALTTLGRLPLGAALNLERALRADARLGGHLVSGHVDGVGQVLAIEPDARAQRWRFAAPPALLRYIAKKGSICVDGASLTVNAVDGAGLEVAGFEVTIIPHTVAHTAFAATRVGDAVNLEIDLVARYVERLLSTSAPSTGSSGT